MKIMYINTFYYPHVGGGAELTLKLLVEGVKNKGCEVVVLATDKNQGVSIDYVEGVKVYRCGIENKYWHFKNENESRLNKLIWHARDRFNKKMKEIAAEIIEKEKPDLISCHNITGWSAAVWEAGVELGVPVVEVLHDLYLLCPRSNMFKNGTACKTQCVDCSIFRLGHEKKSRALSSVVGVSKYIIDKFESYNYFKGVNKHVIHNAREISDPGEKALLSEQQDVVFGYIGTINEAKGVEWLLDQFIKHKIRGSLIIAGTGDVGYIDKLKKISESQFIKFVGFQKPEIFFKNINVCVIPSMWPDTFPGVAIEASAYRVPVIASMMGGLPEIIRDGLNGVYCYPDQIDTLGDAMRYFSESKDKLKEMSENCRGVVEDLLSTNRLIDDYLSLYSSILKQ